MSLDVQKEKINLNRVTHSVRASQAVLQYGVGAMVDFPDQTLMTAAPEYWQERVDEIHDERLEKLLRVDYFGTPSSKGDSGISYTRFPEWYFCPKCRKFQPLSKWLEDYKSKARSKSLENDPNMVKHMKCPSCFQDLVVARVITICEHGHIDDFPWVKWTHCQHIGGARPVCGNPNLTFKTGASSTEGLEGLEISCRTCGARATLKGAFDNGKLEELDKKYPGEYNFHCTGRHPWKHKKEACELHPKVVQRGSSSVYFPVIASSLVIPPYSNLLTKKIEESQAFADCKTTITNSLRFVPASLRDTIVDGAINEFAEKIAREVSATVQQARGVLERKWKTPQQEEECSTQSVKYRAEEYEALSGEVALGSEDYGDFLRESTNINDYHLPFIKQISLIHKIREVQALIGFTRQKPAERSESSPRAENVVPIKEPGTNWYPAYQVRGEGIFIEFDQDAINHWRSNNPAIQHRIDILNDKYAESFIGKNNPRVISAKFLLLHTISHLLIKQLSFECGYSIASLKERIYCSEAIDGKEMAGILIYTASGDSEGTMGGLVRQGRADTFPKMFKKAIESAMTCSNDPVCSLSQGQGRDSLNMAACYSCTLIPETSCEEFNVFLDRGVVVGTFNNKNIAFFNSQLYGEAKWNTQSGGSTTLTTERPVSSVTSIIPGVGTDMSAVSYKDIWGALLQWAEGPEYEIISQLRDSSAAFAETEKPLCDCEFLLSGSSEKHECDLLWKKARIAFFTESNNDDYLLAKGSTWRCFSTADPAFTVQKLLAALKET